jgi:hypothetical protein
MGKSDQAKEVELRPDGWERFNRAVTAAVKSGPKHRAASKPKKTKAKQPKTKPQKSV